MPSLYRSAAALAMASAAFANPLKRGDDSCAAAVTGAAALGDSNLRREHCSSFFRTIVTPAAITVTTTITDAPSSSWSAWKRDVTVCPNEVPNYASACNEAGYRSACNAFGVSRETTITIPATTTTKTVYIGGGKGGSNGVCTSTTVTTLQTGTAVVTSTVTSTSTKSVGTVTATVTSTVGGGKQTVTETKTATVPNSLPTGFGNCLTDAKAQEFADAFTNLLEFTSYNGSQGAPGRGYNFNISAKYLAVNFTDYSDSINWMAGFPLGSVTFPSRAAFDYGQGVLQPEIKITQLNIWHSCDTITWRWSALTPTFATVVGINQFVLTKDLTQIQTNYAEFNNAAWINSFNIPGNACKIPSSSSRKLARSIGY